MCAHTRGPGAHPACELLAVNGQHQEVSWHLLVEVVGNTQQQVGLLCQVNETVLWFAVARKRLSGHKAQVIKVCERNQFVKVWPAWQARTAALLIKQSGFAHIKLD
jgi:hypothetical protein